jgi:hypothetical protein
MPFELVLLEGLAGGAAIGVAIALALRFTAPTLRDKADRALGYGFVAAFLGVLPLVVLGRDGDSPAMVIGGALLLAVPLSTSAMLFFLGSRRAPKPANAMRLRPWHVFFLLWIPFAVGLDALDAKDQAVSAEALRHATQVTARVVGRASVRRSYSAPWARVRIPTTFGITSCEVVMTRKEFDDNFSGEITVYVVAGNPPRCFTANGAARLAADGSGSRIFGAMVGGTLLAWLFYYPLIRIRLGAAGSLRTRWAAERAAETERLAA